MSTKGVKRKAAHSKKDVAAVKRHKSDQISVASPKNEQKGDKIKGYNAELLRHVSDLLVKQKITKTCLSLKVTEAENNWLKLSAKQFCFEVWWHEDKREDRAKKDNAKSNSREGLREAIVHRTLRKFGVPHLLVADLDFEFNGTTYLLRQIHHREISLENFIRNFDTQGTNLTIQDLKRGVQLLDYLWHTLTSENTVHSHLQIWTRYTATNTIMVIDKTVVKFYYKVTYKMDMILFAEDQIGEQWYFKDIDAPRVPNYPVFESMAKAAELIGASKQLIAHIRNMALGKSTIDDVMKCDEEQTAPESVKGAVKLQPEDENKQLEANARTLSKPEPITINDQVLQYVSEQVMKNMALSERPIFLKVEEDTKWCQRLKDQHDNHFEITWHCDITEGQKTMMVHKIMREAKVPHLLTADFGFEYGNHYAIVRQYDPKLIRPHCTPNLGTMEIWQRAKLTLEDAAKGLQQMTELFSTAIVPRDKLSESRPVVLFNRHFDSADVWLVPDGQGGYDFKYLVNSRCEAMKLADDGVGVIVYTKRPFRAVRREPAVSVFGVLADIVESLGDDESFQDILMLDLTTPTFEKEADKIIKRLKSNAEELKQGLRGIRNIA